MSDCRDAVDNMTLQRMMLERAIKNHEKSEKSEGVTKDVLNSHTMLYLGSVAETYMQCSSKPKPWFNLIPK